MKFRQALFWDVDPSKIDPKKNAQYIVERVLELGNDKEIKWIWDFYGKSYLKKVTAKSRSLRPKTRNLWTLILKNN